MCISLEEQSGDAGERAVSKKERDGAGTSSNSQSKTKCGVSQIE